MKHGLWFLFRARIKYSLVVWQRVFPIISWYGGREGDSAATLPDTSALWATKRDQADQADNHFWR